MIVRLKKRGEWPHPTGPVLGLFRGCCFEVEPAETFKDDEGVGVDCISWPMRNLCHEPLFVITDGRYLALSPNPEGIRRCICAHYLIDDIDAFDSDFCDEEAKEGDLAFAQIPMVVQR